MFGSCSTVLPYRPLFDKNKGGKQCSRTAVIDDAFTSTLEAANDDEQNGSALAWVLCVEAVLKSTRYLHYQNFEET